MLPRGAAADRGPRRRRLHQIIPTSRIDYIEAADDAVLIATAGTKVRKQQTLSDLATALDPARFLRIPRSYVLNIDRLERIELYAKDSRVAILRDGTKRYTRVRELM